MAKLTVSYTKAGFRGVRKEKPLSYYDSYEERRTDAYVNKILASRKGTKKR